MTKRKFYRTTVKLVILHEEPYEKTGLADMDGAQIKYAVEEGDMVLACRDDETEELDGGQAAAALVEAGSEPEFFQLTTSGNDGSELLRCRMCHDEVPESEMRAHMDAHDDRVSSMSSERVRDCFEAVE